MNWDEIKDSLADVIVFLIKCLPVIFVIGYIIFYIAVLRCACERGSGMGCLDVVQ